MLRILILLSLVVVVVMHLSWVVGGMHRWVTPVRVPVVPNSWPTVIPRCVRVVLVVARVAKARCFGSVLLWVLTSLVLLVLYSGLSLVLESALVRQVGRLVDVLATTGSDGG